MKIISKERGQNPYISAVARDISGYLNRFVVPDLFGVNSENVVVKDSFKTLMLDFGIDLKTQEEMILLQKDAIAKVDRERWRSERDGVFHFSKWHTILPWRVVTQEVPESKFFESLPPNVKSILEIVDFSRKYHSHSNSWSDLKTKKLKIPTLRTGKFVAEVCELVTPVWSELDVLERCTVWSMLYGFHDRLKALNNKRIVRVTGADCQDYVDEECKLGRMMEISKKKLDEIFPDGYLACDYFKIEEEKVDERDGSKYVKKRFVANNCLANEIILPPADDLKYDFPNAVTIFTDLNKYLDALMSKTATCVDRSDFYRLIYKIPSAVSVVKTFRGWYLDLRNRQGESYSPANAQLVSNLGDKIWSLLPQSKKSKATSLLDDTLILNPKNKPVLYETITSYNDKLDMCLNPKKTQYNEPITVWSGYEWNFGENLLGVNPEKLKKIPPLIRTVTNKDEKFPRRILSKLIGKLYAYRLISFGANNNMGATTYRSRKVLFKDCEKYLSKQSTHDLESLWFISDDIKKQYKAFFDSEIRGDPELANELCLAWAIISSKVRFQSVRRRVFDLNSLPIVPRDHNQVDYMWTDASSYGFAIVIIRVNAKPTVILSKFPPGYDSISINTKEMLTVFIGCLYAVVERSRNPNLSKSHIMFIDNDAARSTLASRKPRIRSPDLAWLAVGMNKMQLCFDMDFLFCRVPTEVNKISDIPSREKSDRKILGLLGASFDEFKSVFDSFSNSTPLFRLLDKEFQHGKISSRQKFITQEEQNSQSSTLNSW